VDDPNVKRSLADDPNFFDHLNDLDRGLHTARSAPAPSGQAQPIPAQPLPPLAPRSHLSDPPRHRPLLDLFPVAPFGSQPSRRPMPPTAVAPSPPEVPQPRDLTAPFPSREHERVMATVLTAIRDRDAVTVVTGEPGVGTTTLCRALVRRLDRQTFASLVLQPLGSVEDLLKTMLVDFGVVGRGGIAGVAIVPRDALVAALRSFIASLGPLRASAAVIIDDAGQQPAAMLEALGELIGRGDAAPGLLVVLAGRPQLKARLADRPKLRPLDAAIRSRVELGPLARDEMAGYVEQRLSVTGPTDRVPFDERALDRIFELSRGVPGVVNLLCDRALAVATSRSAATIDASMIVVAAPEQRADAPPVPAARPTAKILVVAALLAAFTFAGASAGLWIFRDDAARTFELWQNVPAAPAAPALLQPDPLRAISPPGGAPGDQRSVNPRVTAPI